MPLSKRDGETITWYALLGNVFLTGLKAICGILGRSEALIADAVHSAADIGATAVVLLGLKVAKRPRDETHPYGHGRIESITALVVGVVLLGAAVVIVREAMHSALTAPLSAPGWIAIGGVLTSIVAKEWMFRYTLKMGRRLNSPSIIANAWDHRSDAYSSIGVLIGISGAKLGYPLLDPIAAGVVAVFIFKTGFDIVRNTFHDLMDRALPTTIVKKIRALAKGVDGVLAVGDVRGRRMGSKVIADVRITVSGFATAKEGHNIAREVEKRLLDKIHHLAEVFIHVDVEETTSDAKQAQFEKRTQDILAQHSDLFLEVHELDYHFSEEGKEIHFHLVVPPNTTFEVAHKLSKHLEMEIQQEFPDSTVVVHLEPASQKKRIQ